MSMTEQQMTAAERALHKAKMQEIQKSSRRRLKEWRKMKHAGKERVR